MRALTFAEILRQSRKEAGLSQEKLAELAQLSRRGVSDLERGLILSPHHDTVIRLAAALKLDAPNRDHFHAVARGVPWQNVLSHPGTCGSRWPPLVGREAELTLLRDLLIDRGPPALFLTGEPGIGKSRLLAEAAHLAREGGWQVISGGCTRRSGQEPYEPWTSALGYHLAATPPAAQREHLRGCAWLVRLLPELVEGHLVPAPSWTLPPEQERRLMFQAVRRYLANVAGPAGILLLLDDLQWAGSDALALLANLVMGEGATPLRILGAHRSTEVRPIDPLRLLLTDLAKDKRVAQRELPLLSDQESAQLWAELWHEHADGPPEHEIERMRDEILRRADGLPFFLVSSVRSFQAGGDPLTVKDGSLAETIRSRVGTLPDSARELLSLAAVAGRIVSGALILATTRLGEDEALDALDVARQAGLIVEEDGAAYRFTHDLIREVIEGGLSDQRKRALHRRIAHEMARLTAGKPKYGPADIAYHFSEAGESALALPYAMQAGDQAAMVYAYIEAEKHYQLAVDVARAISAQRQEAETLEGLSRVRLSLARYREALATIDEALIVFEALGDVEGQARLAEDALRAHSALASFDVGIARFAPMIDVLRVRGLSALGQARLHSALADVLQRDVFYNAGEAATRRLSEALLAAERAIALARSAGDDGVLARAMLVQGHALVWLGRFEESLDVIESALPLAEAAGDVRLLSLALSLGQAGREIYGDFDLSQRYVERGLALSDRVGAPVLAAHVWHNQAELAYYRGDWVLARQAIERSLAIAQTYELGENFPDAQRYLSHLYLAAGDRDQAKALIAAPLALARVRQDLQALRMSHTLIAECDLLAGCAEVARTYLAPLLDRPGLKEQQVLFVLPQYAWALLMLGDENGAEANAMQSCERARAHHHYLWLVDGLWVLAMVRMHQARWEEARALLEECIAKCRTMPYPYAEAKALYRYGQLHTAQGELGRAREKYGAALSLCGRLGEGLYSPHIERALAAL